MGKSETDKIIEQVKAFEDNMMDVGVLQHDAESKIQAEVKVETLHNRLADLNASIHDQEYEAMSKICELEKQLSMKTEELEKVKGTGRGVYALPGIVNARFFVIQAITIRKFRLDKRMEFHTLYDLI